MTPDERDNLDWLAFQYISHELPDQDAAEFESRLADDQDAREAVARSVELMHTLAAVSPADKIRSGKGRPVAVLRKQTVRWKRVAWLAIATSACLAFILSRYVFDSSGNGGDDPPIAGQSAVSADIAFAWVEARDEFESPNDQVYVEEFDGRDEGLDRQADGEVDVETPDWLVAAVAAMHKQIDDTNP